MAEAVSVAQMRESDARTIAGGVPSAELMFRAGRAIFELADWKPPVAVVCGKGNNGGDGYVTALLLREAGIPVELILAEEKFSSDGRLYYDRCRAAGIPARLWQPGMEFSDYGSVLDCLLGTGFSGTPRSPVRELIEAINRSGAYVVSADINSGLNGDTGLGEVYVRSDLTVSIGTYKYGHFRGLAAEAMQQKTNADIGIRILGETVNFPE